ncbi:TIGR03621 family F420-dependent LLM class oxidoreductase [Amycolatopsis circi]|uniref:TIGR03621 family F420-dependent LLM class oxidoreductase n=1 Tax=Amycolatopsis circi TaxID=871959 RepID=UPI000E288B7E|nr:TIGR03621 family F420-dependent LLM class oxidoreductase [Amycolatopsis circi]
MTSASGGSAPALRFGINLLSTGSRREFVAKCRKAESLGYDVLLLSDHLRLPASPANAASMAPLPALVSAAEATERPKVGTFVLNGGFHNPLLLARDIATIDRLTDGRLELGLGTGYVRGEFEAAGLPWGSAKTRVDRLETLVREVGRLLAEPGFGLDPVQKPRPPLLIGANGDRMLRFAAGHADIVGFSGLRQDPGKSSGELTLVDAPAMAERVEFLAKAAGETGRRPELNVLVHTVAVTADPRAATRGIRGRPDGMTDNEALELPGLLAGSGRELADRVRARRERFGFSYFTVLEPFMDEFGHVIEQLR